MLRARMRAEQERSLVTPELHHGYVSRSPNVIQGPWSRAAAPASSDTWFAEAARQGLLPQDRAAELSAEYRRKFVVTHGPRASSRS